MNFNEDVLGDGYDWATFTLPSGTNDYDVKANQATLFLNVPCATILTLDANANIGIKFNRTSFPLISLSPGSLPLELVRKLNIRNLYLSNNSGVTATFIIWLFQ